MKDDCIFCKIANHVIESTYVYEDELVTAFRDMNPQAPTHVLVVPKEHYDNIVDGVPAETLAALTHAVDEVAKAEGIRESGFRLIANTGDAAGQTVHHLHLHVLGGKTLGEGLVEAECGGTNVDDNRSMALPRRAHGTIVVDVCTTNHVSC